MKSVRSEPTDHDETTILPRRHLNRINGEKFKSHRSSTSRRWRHTVQALRCRDFDSAADAVKKLSRNREIDIRTRLRRTSSATLTPAPRRTAIIISFYDPHTLAQKYAYAMRSDRTDVIFTARRRVV